MSNYVFKINIVFQRMVLEMIKRGIFSVAFNGFESNPLSARELIKLFNSLDTYEIYEYDYYLVSDFDESNGELNYYIVIPITKKIEKVVSILSQTSDAKIIEANETKLLVIPLEKDNELLLFMKRIEPVVKSYYNESQNKKFFVNVTPNDVVIDEKNGNIIVSYLDLDVTDPVVNFVLFYEYFNMGKILFKVHDFLIVSADGSILITRFKKVQTPKELPKSSILIEVVVPDVKPELKRDVIVHRVNILFEEVILMNETYFSEVTKKVTEYLKKKGITDEQITELIDALYNKKLSITTNMKKDKKLSMRVITPYGEIYTTSILPEFTFETIIRAYYGELTKEILPIIKNMKPKIEEKSNDTKQEPQITKQQPEQKENAEVVEVKKPVEKKHKKKKNKQKSGGFSFSLFGSNKKKDENKNKGVEVVEETDNNTTEELEENIEILTPQNKDTLIEVYEKKDDEDDIELEISLI